MFQLARPDTLQIYKPESVRDVLTIVSFVLTQIVVCSAVKEEFISMEYVQTH